MPPSFLLPIESKMEIFARMYSKDTGVEIKFGSGFSTDGRFIYIVPVTDQNDPWIRFMTEVLVYHETGHIKTGDFPTFKAISDPTKRFIFNVVRDVVVEKTMETKYPGMINKWIEFLTTFTQKTLNRTFLTDTALNQILKLFYIRCREQILDTNVGLFVKPEIQELFDLRLAQFVNKGCSINTVPESLKLTEEIYNAIKEDIPEPPKQDQQQPGDGEGQESDGNSSSQSSGSSGAKDQDGKEDSDDASDGNDGDSKQSQVGGKSNGKPKADKDKGSDEDGKGKANPSDDGDEQPASDNENGSGSGDDDQGDDDGDQGEDDGKGGTPQVSNAAKELLKKIQEQADKGDTGDTVTDMAVQQINKYAATNHIYRTAPGLKEHFDKVPYKAGWEYEVAGYEKEGRKMVGFVGGKLKTLLVSEQAPVWYHNLNSGKLDTRKVYKLGAGRRDIFKRKSDGVFEDAAVYQVIDHSGSMIGEKATYAQSILAAVSRDLDKLRIPFGAVGFTSYCDSDIRAREGVRCQPCQLKIIKTFEESYRKVRNRFVWPERPQGTVELPGIQYAAQQLAMRRETKKIMFILTDGETSSGSDVLDSALVKATKEFIQRISRAGIRVVGIGLCDDYLHNYCPDFIHVQDIDTFARDFYRKLTKLLV